MALYEHVFMARQDITAAQMQALIKTYQTVIEDGGGKVPKVEYWGLKSISYKIKKNRKAHYALMNLDAPHQAIAEMERQMSISTDVIRYITVKVDELEEKPSAAMRRSDDRERERGERGDFRGGDRPGGDRDRRPPRREGGFDREGGGFRGGDRDSGGGGGRFGRREETSGQGDAE